MGNLSFAYVGVYVDDEIVICNDDTLLEEFEQKHLLRFKSTVDSDPKDY